MSYADFELNPKTGNVEPAPRTRAAHPGSGRPPGYSPEQAEKPGALDDPAVSEATKRGIRASIAKLEKAEWDAKNAELKYKVESGEYLSRSAFREASATLLQELAQGLRSLPDVLERDHSLAPKILSAIEKTIDQTLLSIATGLEMFTEQNPEK